MYKLLLGSSLLLAYIFLQTKQTSAEDWGGNVVELTDSNFNSKVLDSDDVWLVNFYASWCPHCQRFKPKYEEASRSIKKAGIKNVKLGAIDASQYQQYAQEYNIPGFPTLKYFPAGKKTSKDAQKFSNYGSADEILKWAEKISAETKPPPDVIQLTSASVFKKNCNNAQICVLAFLPRLYDCRLECRKRYIDRLKKISASFTSKSWAYLWSEIRAQPDIEKDLDINDSPALVAVNVRKKAYSRMQAAFSEEDITDFLKGISYGKGQSALIKNLEFPSVKKIAAWDGSDYKPKASSKDEL